LSLALLIKRASFLTLPYWQSEFLDHNFSLLLRMADSNDLTEAMAEFIRLRYPELLNRAANLSAPPGRASSPPSTPAVTHNPLPGKFTLLNCMVYLRFNCTPIPQRRTRLQLRVSSAHCSLAVFI
jgi:hypothetical protein